MKTLIYIAGILSLFAFSNLAKATLIGQEVDYLHEYSFIGNQFRFAERTVEAGAGDNVIFGAIGINVEADSIIFTSLFSGTYAAGTGLQPANRVSVLDLFWAGDPNAIITGVSGVANFDTVAAGMVASDLTFDKHSVSLELKSQQWGLGSTLTVFLQTSNTVTAAVPEPSLLSLFALGLFGLGLSRRKA